jgi:hypothetical protein
MDTNQQAIAINPAGLPKSENIIFRKSSFFKVHGANAELPTPATVRKEAAKPKNLPDRWGTSGGRYHFSQ